MSEPSSFLDRILGRNLDLEQTSSANVPSVKASEVFTPSVPAARAFVARPIEEKDLREKGLDTPGTQIVVWGESGAGKSSLVNKVLADAGRTAVKTACTPDSTYEAILSAAFAGTGAFYVSESSFGKSDQSSTSGAIGADLIGAKVEHESATETSAQTTKQPLSAPQLNPQTLVRELGERSLSWVIEDFHKVPPATRQSLAHALKVFADEGARYANTTIIVLGVSDSVEELVQGTANLDGRVIDIWVKPLNVNQLGEILRAGERLLNVNFDEISADLLATSVGVASITHALALNCCDERSVKETAANTVEFSVEDFNRAVQAYARTRSGNLRSRFEKALIVHRRRKFLNTELILRALAKLPEGGGPSSEILRSIRDKHPKYPHSNLTKYLRDLQEDERGALIRRTSMNTYRFAEPLQHAYAKAYFGETGSAPGAAVSTSVVDDFMQSVWQTTMSELLASGRVRQVSAEDVEDQFADGDESALSDEDLLAEEDIH